VNWSCPLPYPHSNLKPPCFMPAVHDFQPNTSGTSATAGCLRVYLGGASPRHPKSGDYVLGEWFLEVGQASHERFGTRPVYFFRIGGGGAVKIGGPLRRGRLSG